MPLTKCNLNLPPELFAKHGVNVNDDSLAKRVNDRNKRMEKLYNQQNKRNKQKVIWDKSLWASGEISFNFKNWEPNERQNPIKAKNLGNKAFKLAHQMATNGHLNVIMSGDAGVGKTSLALAMLSKLKQDNKTVLFVSVIALSQLVSDQYEYNDRKEQLRELKRAMCECDVLLLDDLGADGGSAEKVMSNGYTGARKDVQALMFDVANNRYEGTRKEQNAARKAGVRLSKPVHQTIITTNNMTEELERIYGERTISRLISRDPNHRLAFNDMEDMRTKEGI